MFPGTPAAELNDPRSRTTKKLELFTAPQEDIWARADPTSSLNTKPPPTKIKTQRRTSTQTATLLPSDSTILHLTAFKPRNDTARPRM